MASLEMYRMDALITAKQLRYSKEVRNEIKKAKTEGEITRALMKGRSEL